MADHVREAINAAKTYSEKVRRETRTALTAVCFFRRTENLCRIAPKTEYERGMPRYPADDTRHIFLNLNRYGGEQNRKPHLMLKRYGGEQNRKLHSMLKRYREGLSRETRTALTAVCFFRRTENLCRIAPKTEYERGMPRYPADDTRHIFLNLNRYGGEYSRKLHSMLKNYGGEYSPKLHSMLKNYGER